MNVRLDWRSDFLGICNYQDKIYPNKFEVELQMVTKSENTRHQFVAFERMKLLVTEIFNHSIFVYHESPIMEAMTAIYPEKMVLLPEEPYDQVIALALYCKANAIMENVMACNSVRISSHFGDHVWYQYDHGDNLGPFEATPRGRGKRRGRTAWWHRNDLMTFDATGDFTVTTWEELDLAWEEPQELPIETVSAKKKTDQSTEVIDMKKAGKKKFQAEVVKGGKHSDED